MANAPMPAAQAIATLQAAGVNACKSPARGRGRCQTLCYLVAGQYVNLGRLRQLARETLEAQAAPEADPLAAACAELAAALEPHPDSLQVEGRRLAVARVTLPGEPPAAPPVPPAGPEPTLPPLERVAAARAAARALEATAPPAGAGVAAHRAAAAAGRPVSLAALARDLGRGLGLAAGGRLPVRYGATGDIPPRRPPAALPPVTEAQAQGLAYCRAALRAAAARL